MWDWAWKAKRSFRMGIPQRPQQRKDQKEVGKKLKNSLLEWKFAKATIMYGDGPATRGSKIWPGKAIPPPPCERYCGMGGGGEGCCGLQTVPPSNSACSLSRAPEKRGGQHGPSKKKADSQGLL